MAEVGNTYLGLADLFKQQDRDGNITDVIEQLAKADEILMDAPVIECNSGTAHLTTVRTGLPTPTWRKIYGGVTPTKSTTAQVKEPTGMMEDWIEIDAKLVDIAKNPQKFRMNEAKAHLQGMRHEFASTLIYGDTDTDPEKFTGLAQRFNDKSADNGNQIIDAQGSGSDNTSIWFITWGENSCHLIYPEGTMAGMQREDKGKETKENSDGTLYDVYREKLTMDVGLSLRDWRGVSRVANIDVSDLTSDASSGADLIDYMVDAYYQLDNPMGPDGFTAVYCGRTIAKFLHKQAMNKSNVQLALEEFAGRKVPTFLNAPIRRVDSILETESQVT